MVHLLNAFQDENFLKSRRYLLQNQIRRASVNFIKDTLVGLPSLPTEEELVRLQEKRKEDIARKVEEERRKAQEARIRFRNLQVSMRSVFLSTHTPRYAGAFYTFLQLAGCTITLQTVP